MSNRLGTDDILVAARKTLKEPFSKPELVGQASSFSDDRFPWISSDDRRLVFASTRNAMQWEIFVTERAGASVGFDAPRVLVSDPQSLSYEPFVDEARSELYFASNRGIDAGLARIWHAPILGDGGVGAASRLDLGADGGAVWHRPRISTSGRPSALRSTAHGDRRRR